MAKPLSSVSRVFTISRGLFAPGDRISLVPTLRVEPGELLDAVTGARHSLHEQAQPAMDLLAPGIGAEEWIVRLMHQGADPVRISQMVEFINTIGGFQVQRAWYVRAPHALHQLASFVIGFRPLTLGRRYPATLLGFFSAAGRALMPVLLAVPVAAALWYGAGADEVAVVALTGALALWFSVAMHEYAHTLPLKANHRVIFQRGLRLGILHRRGRIRQEVISALAGPVAGAAVALAIAPNPAGWFLAVVHLSSLLPVHSDGRAMYLSIRSART